MDTLILLANVVITIYFPFYLRSYFLRKRLLEKLGGILKPPFLTMILYILLLAILAYVSFFRFESYRKDSEARTNLGAIYVAQTAYFSDANTYASGPNAFDLMNWSPAGQTRYAYFSGDQIILNKLPGVPEEIRSGEVWPIHIKPRATENGFIALAVGNWDNDDFLDVWMINDNKELIHLLEDGENLNREEILFGHPSFYARGRVWFYDNLNVILTVAYGLLWAAFILSLLRDRRRYGALMKKLLSDPATKS